MKKLFSPVFNKYFLIAAWLNLALSTNLLHIISNRTNIVIVHILLHENLYVHAIF